MRKHSARKWLHFVLDLLPILVLPIFAIYEINHDHNTLIEVEVDNNVKVDFNQKLGMDNVSSTPYGLTFTIEDNLFTISGTATNTVGVNLISFETGSSTYLKPIINHVYYIRNRYFDTNKLYVACNGFTWLENNGVDAIGRASQDMNPFYLNLTSSASGSTFEYSNTVNIFDLTQMFGAGNEPSIAQFNIYYSGVYPYTVSDIQLLNMGTITESNTDIGSQMMYALYKPVKDYFNFNNVFNFGDIYNWFELNMFGGNAPMPIFIVWNIIVYQFLMDLMFLVYSIFMFIIDFTSECLERCFSFSRHGGSR